MTKAEKDELNKIRRSARRARRQAKALNRQQDKIGQEMLALLRLKGKPDDHTQ